MSLAQAKRMSDFIKATRSRDILELGFAHGVSTCYMAEVLREQGLGGAITTIDLASGTKRKPSIEELLTECELSEYVTYYFEPKGFTWRLMKMLDETSNPCFDLVYLDGGHSWDCTGFAFFLVDKLLRPGGWLIFDDIDWTYHNSQALKDSEQVAKMPIDFRETPQVRKVFELLVLQHPSYINCKIEDKWGYAQKKKKGLLSFLKAA